MQHPGADGSAGHTAVSSEDDGLPASRRYWAMATIFLGISMAVLDGTISNVALPTIARDLHVSPASSIWVVNAYQLAITVSLLPLASLGEIVGYQRVYRAGLVLFMIGSLLCSLSGSLVGLTLARVLQGFGAAGIMSVNAALVRFIYPKRHLGRGIGLNAMVVALATAIGPTVAAGILAVADWPWLFAVNVPIGIVAVLIAITSLPRTPVAVRPFDTVSALLSAATFGLLIVSIDSVGHKSGVPLLVATTIATLACGVLLVRRQIGQPAPLLPIDLLRIPIFALSIATSVLSFAAQMVAFVSLPFYIQNTLGHSEVQTGLLLTPWPLALVVVAPVAGRLSDRVPAGLLGALGLLAMGAGLLLIAALPAHPDNVALIWRLALCGAGFGLFQTPNNRTMLLSAPRSRSGGASGMLSTARLLGQTSGAAFVAMIFLLTHDRGSTACLEVAAGFALVAAIISLSRLGTPRASH
ncbi:MAG: MFS transporter [Janthinobacterium lividum]